MAMRFDSTILEQDSRGIDLALWMIEALGLQLHRLPGGILMLDIPAADRERFAGRAALELSLGNSTAAQGLLDGCEPLAVHSPLFRWLLERYNRRPAIMHATCGQEAPLVEEVAATLARQYRAPGATAELENYEVERRPVLRLTYLHEIGGAPRICHVYAEPSGNHLPEAMVDYLEARPLRAWRQRDPDRAAPPLQVWRGHVESVAGPRPHLFSGARRYLASTVIWCRYVTGLLAFRFGPDAAPRFARIPIQGWEPALLLGAHVPPPYRCPLSGQQSYDLTQLDDGRITVEEAVETCSQSGRRVLGCQLVRCWLTGKKALPEYLARCAVSGDLLIRDKLARCRHCRQRVSPHALDEERGICLTCRQLERVAKDQPHLARVLGEHAELDRWGRWKLAEGAQCYVLTARRFFQRLLLVVDKESLEPRRVARAGWRSCWKNVPRARWREYLGESPSL